MSRPGVWDVVIVGGGAIGSSVAYHLERADPGLKILVVERDPTYQRASSSLSAGNARIQFSLLENIQISLYSLEVFARFGEEMTASGHSPDIRFRAEGNLFLHDARACTAARKAMDLQRSLGGEVEWLSGEEIAARFDAERLTAATFGPRDGHLDGYALLMGYRAKAESMGVDFVANEATEVVTRDGRVAGIRLAGGERVSSPVVVNCAGAWAAALSRTAGIELPVVPVKRQVFVVETPESFDRPLPLTVLPSGLYFRSEAPGLLLVGRSLKEDPQVRPPAAGPRLGRALCSQPPGWQRHPG
jgi:FAD-dependent oxidoreductase domain-containing protein 1